MAQPSRDIFDVAEKIALNDLKAHFLKFQTTQDYINLPNIIFEKREKYLRRKRNSQKIAKGAAQTDSLSCFGLKK